MRLPIAFDLTPKGKIVEKKEIGQDGYAENIQYNLQFNVNKFGVDISYYGEDDTYFDEDRIEELIKWKLKEHSLIPETIDYNVNIVILTTICL